jgi:hypothetical protein
MLCCKCGENYEYMTYGRSLDGVRLELHES